MSFIVREITRRATGGEIVRPVRHDTAVLLVGRSPDCAIQLADLAVLPHHARITQASPDRLVVEVTGGAPIEINKRFINRAEMNPAEGARIIVGSHRLTISREAGSDDVTVTVERTAPVSDAAQAEDEARIFSLGAAMPGKRRMAWGTVALVLALFLIWPITAFLTASEGEARKIHADETWLSGSLSAAHAELKDNCQSCHTKAFVAVRDDACLSCHVKLKDHAAPDRLLAAHPDTGLQAKLRSAVAGTFNLQQWGCTGCHKEHEGPVAMPLTAQSFCSDCHRGLAKELPGTKLLDASDFADDHPEFRPAIVTATAWTGPTVTRVSLDAKPLEGSNLKFPHKLHLSATNGVAQMARRTGLVDDSGLDCANCHTPDETGVRFRPIEMERDCGTCHSLDFAREGGTVRTLRHGSPEQVVAELRDFYRGGGSGTAASMTSRQRPGAFLQKASTPGAGTSVDARIRAVFSEGGACFDCHAIEAPANARSLDFRIKPVKLTDRYMARAWFDHRDHDTKLTACGTCHAASASDQAADLLLPSIAVCRDCHVGSHPQDGKVTSECSSCHTYHVAPGAPRVLKSVGADRPSGGTVVEYKPGGRAASLR